MTNSQVKQKKDQELEEKRLMLDERRLKLEEDKIELESYERRENIRLNKKKKWNMKQQNDKNYMTL